jgi:threonylcarbamoyladenosine tRNA methylthiotransferase CDKAL1
MEGILTNYGFRISPDQNDADLWLLNSCTVKDPSQAAFMNLVRKGKEAGKHVVVAGCVSQADRNISGLEDVSVVGISQIDRVVEAVEQTLSGNTIKILGKKELPRLDLPKVRKNPLVEIIPLSTGCLGSCTYCKTKHARGKLGSYALESIVSRAQAVAQEGVAEIWLSSEDTGAYGLDIGTNISELLHKIVDVLPESGVMLRVGMTNPPYMLEHLDSVAGE